MADLIITQSWQQIGIKDGEHLAANVLEKLEDADTQERIDGVSLQTLGAIANLASSYRDGGVSEPLIQAWRLACQEKMTRVFSELRRGGQAAAAEGQPRDRTDSPPRNAVH